MKNVLEYLENSAALCAEKTAVRDPEESYSYRELTDRARRIGSVLSEVFSGAAGKNRGLPGKPAVVYMEKSVRALTFFYGNRICGPLLYLYQSRTAGCADSSDSGGSAARLRDCGQRVGRRRKTGGNGIFRQSPRL